MSSNTRNNAACDQRAKSRKVAQRRVYNTTYAAFPVNDTKLMLDGYADAGIRREIRPVPVNEPGNCLANDGFCLLVEVFDV